MHFRSFLKMTLEMRAVAMAKPLTALHLFRLFSKWVVGQIGQVVLMDMPCCLALEGFFHGWSRELGPFFNFFKGSSMPWQDQAIRSGVCPMLQMVAGGLVWRTRGRGSIYVI